MNRFLFGRGWVFCDETNGEGDGNGDTGGTAGEGAPAVEGGDLSGDDHSGGGGEGHPADAGKDEGKPKEDMLGAIDKALGYDKEALAAEEKKKTDEAAAKAAAVEKHANGAPKRDAKGNDLDEAGKIVPKQAKTSAELQLSKEQLAALKPDSRARFSEVITTLKARETEIASLNERMKPLEEARTGIMGVLEETHTTSEELSAYLEFNRLVKSGQANDLQTALNIVEEQRAVLYRALGKEPAGGDIDLLSDFPDLKQKVSEAQITREDALEIAQGRREKAARDAHAQQQGRQQQSVQQTQQARDNALKGIDAWVKEIARNDIDYKAKEAKVIDQVDEVIKTYPADKWLPTLKLLYQGITITKAAPQPRRGEQPIRPSGAKPGQKAPTDMGDAINQALGYT